MSFTLTVLGGVAVRVDGIEGKFCVGSVCGALPRTGLSSLDVTVLADASIVEVFADGGRFALTARVYPRFDAAPPVLALESPDTHVRLFRTWKMGSMWLPSC